MAERFQFDEETREELMSWTVATRYHEALGSEAKVEWYISLVEMIVDKMKDEPDPSRAEVVRSLNLLAKRTKETIDILNSDVIQLLAQQIEMDYLGDEKPEYPMTLEQLMVDYGNLYDGSNPPSAMGGAVGILARCVLVLLPGPLRSQIGSPACMAPLQRSQ